MKLSARLLKNRQNFSTPQKRVVSFVNEQSSFEVREPVSSKYIVSKRSIQGTPSTWYLESNRKSQVKSIINLLSDSKVSIQQHFQPNSHLFSPVKEETSQNHSTIKYRSRNNSNQILPQRSNEKIHQLNVRKRLAFDSANRKSSQEKYIQKNSQFRKNQNRISRSRSTSKNKRGISLVKNLIDKKVQNNPQPFGNHLNKSFRQLSPKKQYLSINFSYCKHFFGKIYGQFVQNGQVTKYNFSRILLQQRLIGDLVKDRHFVNKIWQQMEQVTGNKCKENFPMKIVFAFLISVLGYSFQQIQIFQTQQALMKMNPWNNNHQAREIFKYFRHRNKQFRILALSRSKRPKSFSNKKY